MLAARFHAPGEPLALEACPLPAPGPGEALVRVLACGVCGSDVHMRHGRVPVRKTPIILGHEIAETVVSCGPGDGPWRESDPVIVRAGAACGTCSYCT